MKKLSSIACVLYLTHCVSIASATSNPFSAFPWLPDADIRIAEMKCAAAKPQLDLRAYVARINKLFKEIRQLRERKHQKIMIASN